MIVSLSRQPKHDYGPLKKASTTYAERFAKIQEFKEQPTYHPLDRAGYRPFRTTRHVGQGLTGNALPFDHDGETQEHMSQLAETMLDEEHNILLMGSYPREPEIPGKKPGKDPAGR